MKESMNVRQFPDFIAHPWLAGRVFLSTVNGFLEAFRIAQSIQALVQGRL
jgi:hypothetical protein